MYACVNYLEVTLPVDDLKGASRANAPCWLGCRELKAGGCLASQPANQPRRYNPKLEEGKDSLDGLSQIQYGCDQERGRVTDGNKLGRGGGLLPSSRGVWSPWQLTITRLSLGV